MPLPTHLLGFHYFPDTQHYRQEDLQRWLPELQSMGVRWMTLIAPTTHCIPEHFLNELTRAEITPLLHFRPTLTAPPDPAELKLLFKNYARWGVRYAAIFDRPNLRIAWPSATWSHHELVEMFLDQFVPLAECALSCGVTPIFPSLEPGGDYWDTAFLRAALRSLRRRASRHLQREMLIGAYAWAADRPLDWGQGGPRKWPQARPYQASSETQDQRGFRIFEWYAQITAEELGEARPIVLLGCGVGPGHHTLNSELVITRNLEIAHLLYQADSTLGAILAGNIWVLANETGLDQAGQAWYQSDGQPFPTATAWKNQVVQPDTIQIGPSTMPMNRPIAHYVLLPSFDWGISDWHWEVIRPFVKKNRPTVGFSLTEASQASRITVIGNEQFISEAYLRQWRAQGCQVERIDGDGTEIASILAER